MSFVRRYPVPLLELLVAPVIFREGLPELANAPQVSASGMRDLATFAGHSPGAIKTALSRLRTSGVVEAFDDDGVTRYRSASLSRSVSRTVGGSEERPDELVLAVFSFSTDDARPRQVVREALKLHGFQKLAQNVYIHGQINTGPLNELLREVGLEDHVWLFRIPGTEDPVLRRKLTALFDLTARSERLRAFAQDLESYLDPALPDEDFARRYLYCGPVHYRITTLEEPPLPAAYLPAGYPLAAVRARMTALAAERSAALVEYYHRVNP